MNNYPDGVDGSHAYFNEPNEVEAKVIDPEADAEEIKRLALAQALFKAIKAEVGTGNEFNLRGRVDAIMAERFAQAKQLGLAPKSFDVEIDGEKVGTYSITTTKAKPAESHVELRVSDEEELLRWALKNGCWKVDMDSVNAMFAATGEVPPGCEAKEVTTPAVEGGKISRTSLRIDPEKVSYSLGADLGEMARYLLEGGE
jgi:hypothetical protein